MKVIVVFFFWKNKINKPLQGHNEKEKTIINWIKNEKNDVTWESQKIIELFLESWCHTMREQMVNSSASLIFLYWTYMIWNSWTDV